MYLIRGFTECLFSSSLHVIIIIIIIIICYCIIQHIQSNKQILWFYSFIDSYMSHALHLSFIHSFSLSHQGIQDLVFMIHRKETSQMDNSFLIVNHVCYNDYPIHHHHHHLSLHLRCIHLVMYISLFSLSFSSLIHS